MTTCLCVCVVSFALRRGDKSGCQRTRRRAARRPSRRPPRRSRSRADGRGGVRDPSRGLLAQRHRWDRVRWRLPLARHKSVGILKADGFCVLGLCSPLFTISCRPCFRPVWSSCFYFPGLSPSGLQQQNTKALGGVLANLAFLRESRAAGILRSPHPRRALADLSRTSVESAKVPPA